MSVSHPAAVIILAAGQGTRMKSATPKVLHTMCGRSLLGHAIAAARGLEPEHLVVVVRHEGEIVAAHAQQCDAAAAIAWQDEIKGTGRAVWCGLQALPESLDGAVVVMAGDTPLLDTATLSELVENHAANAVTILTTLVPDATGYGRILRDAAGQVCGVVEHRDATEEQRAIREINTSTYAFDAAFLRDALGNLGTANAQGEMYLTDVVSAAYGADAGVGDLVLDDSWLVEGCNDLAQLATLRAQMNRRLLEKWMRSGVSIIDPATTSIDAGVRLEPDCRVEPGTLLRGETTVATGAIVGPGEFENALVGENAVARHVVVHDASIPAGARLSPYTAVSAETESADDTDPKRLPAN
ncbi:NTP transferase domain-containing protein [Actinobaculum sp. 352]|uniref:bifunctional UDP-N-acetylglucosamine diphosphorylase/glucosamine-1-phosphate N-acetyltransferase GlmU n=1 Tax=Actinobaculum sp. 352 TaxID=2490946 RepID=UPI000F7ED9EB|nr:NTP transferase domain-containing protein [Actinobaculum sp. 352]RTE50263.1 UDP-N-acetylglucosamine diphosphorylase [Actinobaculum sp. 352]